MTQFSRRQFLQFTAAATVLTGLEGCSSRLFGKAKTAHVVIIGGGFGGATAAKYIRKLDNTINVSLIEPKTSYITCPGSNWLFAGLTKLQGLRVDYQRLIKHYGIKVIPFSAVRIDPQLRTVTLSNEQQLNYDRLIVAPGIMFRWGQIEGYTSDISNEIPHAWRVGKQTQTLFKQLQAMPDGGKVVICPPTEPYRCPPGPYERASMMAYYLKQHKPKSKIVILDPKPQFSKQALFEAGWQKHYGYGTDNSLIEWNSMPNNKVIRLNAKTKTVETEFGDFIRGDVLNIIPAQKAANIAVDSGLADGSGWCPVNPLTAESLLQPGIHVLGDSAIYEPMPKSAFAANSQAKTCALAVVNGLNGQPIAEANWINTCYSLITPNHGISIAAVYKLLDGKLTAVEGTSGMSSASDGQAALLEASYARSWYDSITHDTFA